MKDADTSFLGLAASLVRHRRLLMAVPLVVGALAVAYGYLSREYVADSRFLPVINAASAPRLSGLAAQFGFNLGAGLESGESTDFYANLLKSRDVLLAAAESEYRFLPSGQRDTVRKTLVTLLHVKGGSPEVVRRRAIGAMERRVIVSTDPQAGMVVLKVVMPHGELAELVNRRLLDLVNEFNLQKRHSQAAAERSFTEDRMRQAQQDLEQAEGDLRAFTERNRIIEGDPALRLEQSRLQRRVDLRQQVYVNLAQAYEQARIAEVRDTPLITVVDTPERSAQPSVSLTLSAILGLLLGFLLGVAVLLAAEYAARQRREHPQAFETLVAEARRVSGAALVSRALRGRWRVPVEGGRA